MRLIYPIFALVLGLLIWQGIVLTTGAPHFILPSPLRVAQAGIANRGLIFEHGVVTAVEVCLGLGIGAVLGAITAILMTASKAFEKLVLPFLIFTQAVPVFALAPILTLWFGYGMGSKIAMAVLIIYFPVTSAFFDGLSRVPPAVLDLARVMGGGKWAVMRHIKIPHALPTLATGLKLAAVYAPIGAVIGEWVGASRGLGYLMLLANGRAKIDLMFACLIALACLTLIIHAVVAFVARALDRYAAGG